METFWDINNIYPHVESVITVGTFDGIHKGHQSIINKLIARAKNSNCKSTLVTFEPHPGLVVGNRGLLPLDLLTTIEEKIDILEQMGLDRFLVTNFTQSVASLSADEFIKNILLQKLNMKQIVIGYDHSFGKDRQGNIELLVKYGKEYNFSVDAIEPVKINDDIVSSTKIRKYLHDGDVAKANELMGRNYSIRGQVIKGDGRGKKLGFPTANIRCFSQYKLVPKVGVYATKIKVDGMIHDSVTYIGTRPTFNLSKKVIEVNIDNFDRELYDQEVELYFVQFIRDDVKFASVAELVPQIESDKKNAIKILQLYN
ncbi:MAG TPA: bifunctional riboflavin kinase/FAD synthetase [bacterium]|nr:bifunctional riboflavin kinase/FAD synthetase [bacterium]HPN45338.1 bifunctional riboflavin kinase/FAD synthetase [bacterium]